MKKALSFIIVAVMVFSMIPFGTAAATEIWDGSIADGFASGDGSETSHYIIATASQLAYLAQQVNEGKTFAGDYFLLATDIVLNDTSKSNWTNNAIAWTPIGGNGYNFKGHFVGADHTITGLYINDDTASHQGLFGSIFEGSVSNVTVKDSYVKGQYSVAAVCASLNDSTADDCHNVNTSVIAEHTAGGVFGNVKDSTVTNCTNSGDVKTVSEGNTVGGIAAKVYDSTIAYCSNNYRILTSAISGIGGIASIISNTKVTYCKNTVNIISTMGGNTTGGIVGEMDASSVVSYCSNTGDINIYSGSRVGGVVGGSDAECGISYCYNTGNIQTSYYGSGTPTNYVGGVVGKGGASNCFNTGNIKGLTTGYIGGVSGGLNGGKLEYCYNIGTIEATEESSVSGTKGIGAIVSRVESGESVKYCYYLSGTYSVGTYSNEGTYSNCSSFTDAKKQTQSTYKGFDFDTVWTFGEIDGITTPVLHSYSEWATDDSNHWHTCSSCGLAAEPSAHEFDNSCDATCNICVYKRNAGHTAGTYVDNGTGMHNIYCSDCEIALGTGSHRYNNWTATEEYHQAHCTLCGHDSGELAHVYDSDTDDQCGNCGYQREIAPAFVRGDVNGDGNIKATDYLILKRVLIGATAFESLTSPETAEARSDVNNNGSVNSTDYLLLKRYLLGVYTIPQ